MPRCSRPSTSSAPPRRVAAELLHAEGQLGTLAAGAHADAIVLDGDPLQDIGLLSDPAAHMPLVIQAGAVVRQPYRKSLRGPRRPRISIPRR